MCLAQCACQYLHAVANTKCFVPVPNDSLLSMSTLCWSSLLVVEKDQAALQVASVHTASPSLHVVCACNEDWQQVAQTDSRPHQHSVLLLR